jgi:hypothetical protein
MHSPREQRSERLLWVSAVTSRIPDRQPAARLMGLKGRPDPDSTTRNRKQPGKTGACHCPAFIFGRSFSGVHFRAFPKQSLGETDRSKELLSVTNHHKSLTLTSRTQQQAPLPLSTFAQLRSTFAQLRSTFAQLRSNCWVQLSTICQRKG